MVGVDSAPMLEHLGPWPPPDRPDRGREDWLALGWGGSGDRAWYDARVAELVGEGEPEAMVRRAIRRRPDGRYHAHPTADVLTELARLGSRPDNPVVRVLETYERLARPTLQLCATRGLAARATGRSSTRCPTAIPGWR